MCEGFDAHLKNGCSGLCAGRRGPCPDSARSHCTAGDVTQVILNPSEEAHWNVVSACNNIDDLKILQVRGARTPLLAVPTTCYPV